MITQQRLKELLHYEPDTGIFTWRVNRSNVRAGDIAGFLTLNNRRRISVDGVNYFAYRLAWLYVYGEFPYGILDHVNRDSSYDGIGNLRIATVKQNSRNSTLAKNNTTGYTGVVRSRDRYAARIKYNYRQIHIGVYDTPEEAFEARKAKSFELFGEFAPERNL